MYQRFKTFSCISCRLTGFISHISLNSDLKPLWSICLARLHLLCVDLSWRCSSWLKGAAESTVGKLDHRISMLTGLNVKHPYGEYLQVVNYGIGGHYEPHFDHATVSWLCKLIGWFSWLKLCWQQPLIVFLFPVTVKSCVQAENWEPHCNFYDICESCCNHLTTQIAARFPFLFFPKP